MGAFLNNFLLNVHLRYQINVKFYQYNQDSYLVIVPLNVKMFYITRNVSVYLINEYRHFHETFLHCLR